RKLLLPIFFIQPTFCMTYSTDTDLTKLPLTYRDIILPEKAWEVMEFMYWGRQEKHWAKTITPIVLYGLREKAQSWYSIFLHLPAWVLLSMIYWKLPPKEICRGLTKVALPISGS